MSTRFSFFAAFMAGILFCGAFAPYNWFPVAVLVPALMFSIWSKMEPGLAFRNGWLFGFGMFGMGVSWVHISINEFGQVGMPIAVALTVLFAAALALFPAVVAWMGSRFSSGATQLLLFFPVVWTLAEWVRGTQLSGFPWLNLGYSQIDAPYAAAAPLVGVYGVSFLAALSAGVIVFTIRSKGTIRWVAAMLLILSWATGSFFQNTDWTQPAGNKFQISVVQGSIPQHEKWLPERRQSSLDLYRNMTREHWDSDVIIWPETAVPAFLSEIQTDFIDPLRAEAADNDTDLIIGVPILEDGDIYNSMIIYSGRSGRYLKRHLVPFGEYFPLRDLLAPIYRFVIGNRAEFVPGPELQDLPDAGGYPVGISICYEDVFGEQIIEALPEAAYLVNASNDAWFGDSLAPHQHLQMARMRALETGRYMIRATNTGISAVINPYGQEVARSPQFLPYTISADIVPMKGETPYVRLGNRWLWGLVALLGVLVWMGRGCRKNNV